MNELKATTTWTSNLLDSWYTFERIKEGTRRQLAYDILRNAANTPNYRSGVNPWKIVREQARLIKKLKKELEELKKQPKYVAYNLGHTNWGCSDMRGGIDPCYTN